MGEECIGQGLEPPEMHIFTENRKAPQDKGREKYIFPEDKEKSESMGKKETYFHRG